MNPQPICPKSILVAGDVMLDDYIFGDIKRISPEAPVPVLHKKTQRSTLGGAANVAANLMAAGQEVAVMSMIGHDAEGQEILRLFGEQSVNVDLVITDNRCTTVKTRFIATNNQQVIRVDNEDTRDLSEEPCIALLQKLADVIDRFDLIVLSDYMKGFLTPRMTQGIISLARAHAIPVIVDVKDPQCGKYAGSLLLKPNRGELHALTGLPVESEQEIVLAAERLQEVCHCDYVLATLGAQGMVLVGDGEPFFVKSASREVFDVSGAGDTTIAYIAACLANGWPIRDSVQYSNLAAGIQVGKPGTSTVTLDEIRSLSPKGSPLSKVLSRDDATALRKKYAGKRIVFTNGCFDILHIGHKRYLEQAAGLGDLLIVGLNSDGSVRRLKGPGRPVNTETERAEMLCAFDFVDYVVIFDEDTPYGLIERVQPDILVKGGDYSPENVVGRDIVEARGGSVVILPFVPGKSTTNILKAISNKQ